MKKLVIMLIVLFLLLSGCSSNVPENSESSTTQVSTADVPAAEEHFSLIASLPEDDIYLYGILPHGVVLYQDGTGRCFDWAGMSGPRTVMPQLKYADFDGDGIKEIAEIECIGTGTGVHVTALHMLKIDKNKAEGYFARIQKYKEYTATVEDLLDEKDFVYKNGTAFYKGEAIGFGERNEEGGDAVGLHFSSIVYFSFDESGNFICKTSVGYQYENWATPAFFTQMIMNISFDGEGFNIDNYHFNNDNYEPFK